MNTTRYVHRTVPLAPNEAQRIRDAQIETTQNEIKYRREQIEECENYIARLRSEPLPTTREEQITLNHGDPGYDEAPIRFDAAKYQGDVTWVNSQPLLPPLNEIRKLENGDFAIGNMIPASNVVQNQLREFYERTLLSGKTGEFLHLRTPEKD